QNNETADHVEQTLAIESSLGGRTGSSGLGHHFQCWPYYRSYPVTAARVASFSKDLPMAAGTRSWPMD
ncbi:MAG: hypothetical protein MI861_04430, partial [Pirellulales bacterium]|nr:hypothetical protein [Pirellulales bacterium]